MFVQVDPGDEESHPLLDVAAEHLLRAGRYPVAVASQPRLESGALLGREDNDVVFANRIGGLDGDAERRLANAACGPHRNVVRARRGRHLHGDGATWVAIEVLDQSRRRIGVEVVDDGLVADVDLVARQQRGHRDDDGEFARVALEVVRHGDHGAVAIPCEHHLRGAVEQCGVRLGDIETAERQGGRGRHEPEEQ